MPWTHQKVASTPDDANYEIRTSHWNEDHIIARTAAEIAAGVTPSNYAYEPGDPRRYGAAADGVADDTSALQAAFNSGVTSLDLGPGGVFKITDTVTVPVGVSVNWNGAKILYAGAATKPAVVVGATGTVNFWVKLLAVWIEAETKSWASTDFVGLRAINLSRCFVEISAISKFTIAYEAHSHQQGYGYNQHILGYIHRAKYCLALTANGAGGGTNYVNENIFYGGSFGSTSSENLDGSSYGVWCRAINGGDVGHNNNRFIAPCFEMGDGQAGDERVPVFMDDCGLNNLISECRWEGGRGPFAKLAGSNNPIMQNRFTVQVRSGTTYQTGPLAETGLARLNRYEASANLWESPAEYVTPDLIRCVYAYSASHAGITGGLHFSPSGGTVARNVSSASNQVRTRKRTVEITSSRGIGFYCQVTPGDSFAVQTSGEAGFLGRIYIGLYDSTFTLLTSASGGHPNLRHGTSGNSANWDAGSFGGTFRATADDQEFLFTVSSNVHFIRVLVAGGGSANARIHRIHLKRLTPRNTPLRVFSGLDDFEWGRYANVNPDGGTLGVYVRGDLITYDAAASGSPPYWVCTTGGRLAPAWAATTAYAVGDLVLNDTNKIYECVTAGTSAGSGGPTGTGSGISDGTATWDYLSAKAVFKPGANLP